MDNIKARFRQYQNVIQESNIVSKTDIDGTIIFVNDEFCKITGFSRDELIGKNHNIVRHPDEPAYKFKQLWDTILAKKVYKITHRNLTKDRRTIYLNTTVIPILNLKGEIEEFVAIRHDVTEIYELNLRLINAQNELKALNLELENRVLQKTAKLRELNINLKNLVRAEVAKNEEKSKMLLVQSRLASMGEMIANIAHQWRQPLNELSLALFTLKQAKNSDKIAFNKGYERCKNLIQGMSRTIEDFSGFFNSNQPAELFKLSSVARESIAMIQASFEREGIKIKFECKKDSEIYGFKNQLAQIIINLLNNAKDAIIERKIKDPKVQISVYKDAKFSYIKVSDNGGGIDKSVIDKIYEPYFTTKHAKQGTGIGLYMSRLIVDRFNGEIKANNENGGASFIIKLPIKESR